MPEFDLDAVVPEDFVFKFRGERYLIPGDITIEDALSLANLFQEAARAELSGDDEQTLSTNQAVAAKLLELFQILQPDLESLPFGVTGYRHVLGALLNHLGLLIVDDEDEEGRVEVPTPPSPGKKPPRSRRSGGSRR